MSTIPWDPGRQTCYLYVMPTVRLARGRERSVLRRHPWIFRGAIAAVDRDPGPGDTVLVVADDGAELGHGAWSPSSQIAVRMWTFDPAQAVDSAFFEDRLTRAIRDRGPRATDMRRAVRLVHSESDGMPGVTVDRYADWLVIQLTAAGAERNKTEIVERLRAIVPCSGVHERSDTDARTKEGLPRVAGTLAGDDAPDLVEIVEGPCRFLVDVRRGHKTGFYLDQRENRERVAESARGRDVLNCFAYSGAFAVRALAAGARHVTSVETSAEALRLAERHVALNGLDPSHAEQIDGDVFRVLRRMRDERRQFDLVVLDPPRFADSRKQLPGACRGYKDVNLLAAKLLREDGVLFTFSCSGHMGAELFQKVVADAFLDAGRDGRILRRLGASPDHPTALGFPEGSYLKGLVCRVR